jgi:hypothetical protein
MTKYGGANDVPANARKNRAGKRSREGEDFVER